MRINPPVTARSPTKKIVEAINKAGDLRPPWRPHDWPKKGERRSWVLPNEIGVSTARNPSLLKRLRAMVAAGILEETHYGWRRVDKRGEFQTFFIKRGMPRFRTIEQ
jgi:hypothetical protein